uniref:Isochorismatase-like domain-containing protein n=1 Tax=Thalassionema nitzschioides TaxID=33649 RepID=A0A6V1C864_9STRA|mmetsp:Transcript_7041/g.5849  ORF Transcript_7041/g.5849 Transcript_7041/m.5849 type:complete len:155 (+) Transcript_7041:40-504(+)
MSFSLDPSKTAFVFIEFQNEFTTEGGKLHDAVKPSLEAFNTMINAPMLLEKARASGCTVVHCPIEFEEGHEEIGDTEFGILKDVKDGEAFTAGTWNADFCDSMKPEGREFIVKGKTGLCGFHSTNLDFILRGNNVKHVVLCGFLANCCVESTST